MKGGVGLPICRSSMASTEWASPLCPRGGMGSSWSVCGVSQCWSNLPHLFIPNDTHKQGDRQRFLCVPACPCKDRCRLLKVECQDTPGFLHCEGEPDQDFLLVLGYLKILAPLCSDIGGCLIICWYEAGCTIKAPSISWWNLAILFPEACMVSWCLLLGCPFRYGYCCSHIEVLYVPTYCVSTTESMQKSFLQHNVVPLEILPSN